MGLYLVPLLGPFHLRMPRYNAATVVDVLEALGPDRVVTSAVSASALAEPDWRDTEEIALPLAVEPWLRRRGMPLEAIGEPPPDPTAEADMRRYLREAGEAERLAPLEAAERDLEALLGAALDAERLHRELLPLLARVQAEAEALFGDGPGTGWRRSRATTVAERARAVGGERVALLAPAEDVPLLREALNDAAPAPTPPPSERSRRRALLDTALRGDASDPASLLSALRELEEPEARVAEADVLLANGHVAEALETLEAASHGDFSEPYHLPGWLLARLGQLYDLAERRDDALRAYRGVLALSWAPAAPVEAARQGLERPFAPDAEVGA